MFEWLFKYPSAVFSKGEFLLLGTWPKWILVLLVLVTVAGLGWLVRSRLPQAAPGLSRRRAGAIWMLQSSLATLLLILLWQPAISVAELKPRQNIIAVLVDDSRSMAISENGSTREARAAKALEGGVLGDLQKKFQTRLYRFDTRVTRIPNLQKLRPDAPATHIGASLRQLMEETSDLPIGAIVLLSDGADNAGGIDRDTIAQLRGRHIAVQTVGFGARQMESDAEIDDVSVAPRALAGSRMAASVTFHQRGLAGQKTALSVRDGGKLLASHEITLSGDGRAQTETLFFNAGDAGVKQLQFSIAPLPGEVNTANNAVTRLVNVSSDKLRILYVEGEPRWEYKFIREAEQSDPLVQLASMLRTTPNTIYRQGIGNPQELAQGFPANAQELFGFQALVIGSLEAAYFTPAQQDLIRQFVNRRGGGLLWLGGRFALADGGWAGSSLADLLPVVLPNRRGTFHRAPATVELTAAGTSSLICRLVDDPQQNAHLWMKLPYLMDYQEAGTPKPGAVVLADSKAGGRTMPLLVTENYGSGRTAVLATSGTWRWQMLFPAGNPTHTSFWQQLLRWLAAGTPGQVVASVPRRTLFDEGHTTLTAEVRDKDYLPAPDASVQAHIIGPDGLSAMVDMRPVPNAPGTFQADWTADQPGSYLAQVTAERGGQQMGQDVVTFQRLDGVAENFHTGQNRDLLEKFSRETGGSYWRPEDLSKLAATIPYSEAGITVRQTDPLWNMPAVFLVILLLLCSEWVLRRKWGVV
ncbi:MAG TPA: glutamine amidotransferase [Patescibacteria group bacterium]|nr:glutamine amidotransferase [Patescibacteria group bacterium]